MGKESASAGVMRRALLLICAAVVAALAVGFQASAAAKAPVENEGHGAKHHAEASQLRPEERALPERDGNRGAGKEETQDQSRPLKGADIKAEWFMVGIAVVQLALTFWGLLFIRGTLLASNAAVREAQRGSDVAVKMALASQERFATERRPWMAQRVLEAVAPIENMEFAFKMQFQNVGASPAFDVAVIIDMDVDDYSFTRIEDAYEDFLRSRMAAHQGGDIVFPGEDHTVTHHIQFSRRQLRERDGVWAKRPAVPKPDISPRVYYAVLYRSPIEGEDGTRTIHHTGGFFSIHGWKGPILIGAPNPPDKVSMIARRATADFLVS